MKKIIFFILLVIISIFLYFNTDRRKSFVDPQIEYSTFPSKEYIDKLEEMQAQ